MPMMFAVPKGTLPSICKAASCRKPIYWVLTGNEKRMPVDVDVPDGKPPTKLLPGQGVPHWGTCVAAKDFHKNPTGAR